MRGGREGEGVEGEGREKTHTHNKTDTHIKCPLTYKDDINA